jgi:PAS domain S-box-containing protein
MTSRSLEVSAAPAESTTFSELRYRRLFETARDGILIIDPETRQIVDVNPYLLEYLGYSFNELVGKELYEIGLLDDQLASQAAFRELLLTGYIRYEDLPLVTKGGQKVDVEFVSNLYQEGDRHVIQCNVRDIAARKLADTALRQSEERFKLVARAVTEVIWDWNLLTESLWWSDNFVTTFGNVLGETDPDRDSWKRRIHSDDLDRVVNGIDEALSTGAESWSADYRFRLRDGVYASVRDNGFILRDERGTAIRMVGGLRDLTEYKKAQDNSARAQRMEGIGTLAGGIAHDLNNVLTPVMMSIELLKFDSGNDPERKTILDTIQVCCRRGADLVRQVLNFARGVDGERAPIRVVQLIKDLNAIIGESFPRNISIKTKVANDLWPITGDSTQIHQVLLNLAVNARDAMPNGGALSITASNVALDPTDVGSSSQTSAGRHVLIRISDTGAGITPANCDHIFEHFFTTKKVGEGTGFGLSIVHEIVKSHGGFLTVDSDVGRGASFNVFLPADKALRTTSSLPPFRPHQPRGHGQLILVVDDEIAIREMTQRTLEAFGYKVITAANGAEAVAIYVQKAQDIALVLTDMMMPVMDGAAAVIEFKRINPLVKIVAVSGLNLMGETKSAVSRFLPKPYLALELIQLVGEVLEPQVPSK